MKFLSLSFSDNWFDDILTHARLFHLNDIVVC